MNEESCKSLIRMLTLILIGALCLGTAALPLESLAQAARQDGWCTAVRPAGTLKCASDPQQACEFQRNEFALKARLYPYTDGEVWSRKSCDWKVCIIGPDCSFVRPASVSFRCDNSGIPSTSPLYRYSLEPGVCLTAEQRLRFTAWGELKALMDNYQDHRVTASNKTSFSHQLCSVLCGDRVEAHEVQIELVRQIQKY